MEKIVIHAIDGTSMQLAVDAEHIEGDNYVIQEFEDFDPEDRTLLPQFIPGDIVATKLELSESASFRIAESLIEPSKHSDKYYLELLYRLVNKDKPKNDIERMKYKESISRIRKEVNEGVYHYPAVVNYVNGLGVI